ncbi:MAG: protein kinase [Candidatus Brocadiae bacterium]|nr:protein kinase [Candidatus Brocadiia bacterium]
MRITFNLKYEQSSQQQKTIENIVLESNRILEITLNKTTAIRRNDIVFSLNDPKIGKQLLIASFQISQENELGIMNHTESPENVKIIYRQTNSEDNPIEFTTSCSKDIIFPINKLKSFQKAGDINEIECEFEKILISYDSNPMVEFQPENVTCFFTDDELLYNNLLKDYKILQSFPVSEGGLYTLFKAEHNKIKGIEVIIKGPCQSIWVNSRGASYIDICQRMSQAMKLLNGHPGIPRIIPQVPTDAVAPRVPFVIMEYIQGRTLMQTLDPNKAYLKSFGFLETLESMKKLAEILEYLHTNKTLHRGIEPSNIILGENNSTLHLVGFGYSKLLFDVYDIQEEEYQPQSLTFGSLRRRLPAKTLKYMPPEFFKEKSIFDYQGDIYSFGAVFYACLLLFPPYNYNMLEDQLKDDNFFNDGFFTIYEKYANAQKPIYTILEMYQKLKEELRKDVDKYKKKNLFSIIVKRLESIDNNQGNLALSNKYQSIKEGLQNNQFPSKEKLLVFIQRLESFHNADNTFMEDYTKLKEDLKIDKLPSREKMLSLIERLELIDLHPLLIETSKIIEKCLHIDKKKRYQSIAEVKRDLDALIQNQNYLNLLRDVKKMPFAGLQSPQPKITLLVQEITKKIQEERREAENRWVSEFRQLKSKNDFLERELCTLKEKGKEYEKLIAEHHSLSNIFCSMEKRIKEYQEKISTFETELKFSEANHIEYEKLEKALEENYKQIQSLRTILETKEEQIKKNQEELENTKILLSVFQGRDIDPDNRQDIHPGAQLPGSDGVKYTIQEKIGAGGMGLIYKAICTPGDSFVAVKMLPKYTEAVFLENCLRFVSETNVLLYLDDPHILRAIDYVQYRYFSYLILEYIEGETLENLFIRNKLRSILKQPKSVNPSLLQSIQMNQKNFRIDSSLAQSIINIKTPHLCCQLATQITKKLVSALVYLERMGIVHRDLTPRNIMIYSSDKGKDIFDLSETDFSKIELKIIDFGLSYPTTFPGITKTNEYIGTYAYMAPERFDGQWGHRSDIYSLGVIYYQMLTGQLPFQGNTVFEIVSKIIVSETPNPRKINPSIPQHICQQIMKMIAKKVEERYYSALELFVEMENREETQLLD